jgi:hypothetical protein
VLHDPGLDVVEAVVALGDEEEEPDGQDLARGEWAFPVKRGGKVAVESGRQVQALEGGPQDREVGQNFHAQQARVSGVHPFSLRTPPFLRTAVNTSEPYVRVLTLVEGVVRERLQQEGSKLQGIYAGQSGRQTARPSAELLLRALQTISVSVVEVNGQTHALLSPLTEVQKRLLGLWNLPLDLYEKVARGFPRTPSKTSEP